MKQTRGMGRVYQQKGSARWWIGYYAQGPDGRAKEVRESSGSTKKSDAVALLRKRTGQIANGSFVEPIVQKTTRLSDLARLVTDNYKVNGLRSGDSLPSHFKRLTEHFGDVLVAQLGTAQIEAFKAAMLTRQPKPYTPASINRSLAALKRGFKLGQRSGLTVTVPIIEMLREDNARQGFLEDADFRRLRDALPEYLRDPVTFLYLSGWRSGEMKTLEWADVDMADKMIRLRPEHSKNKRGRSLPLSGELLEVIKRAFSQRRLGCALVFHREGNPIGDFRKAWATACKLTKLGHVLVHDMRRSATRNFSRVMSQTLAMARTGHVTVSTFQRYNIVSEADMREAAEKLDNHLAARRA
jgi:integrase